MFGISFPMFGGYYRMHPLCSNYIFWGLISRGKPGLGASVHSRRLLGTSRHSPGALWGGVKGEPHSGNLDPDSPTCHKLECDYLRKTIEHKSNKCWLPYTSEDMSTKDTKSLFFFFRTICVFQNKNYFLNLTIFSLHSVPLPTSAFKCLSLEQKEGKRCLPSPSCSPHGDLTTVHVRSQLIIQGSVVTSLSAGPSLKVTTCMWLSRRWGTRGKQGQGPASKPRKLYLNIISLFYHV